MGRDSLKDTPPHQYTKGREGKWIWINDGWTFFPDRKKKLDKSS